MKLALIGQSAFGKSILEKLSDRAEHEIVGVFAAPDTRRSREPLAAAADELELPVWQFNRMRDQECIDVFPRTRCRPMRDGVCDRHRPERDDRRTDPRHDPVPSFASTTPSRTEFDQLGDHQWRRGTGLSIFWPDEGLDTARSCCKNASISDPTTPSDHFISITSTRWVSKRSSSR